MGARKLARLQGPSHPLVPPDLRREARSPLPFLLVTALVFALGACIGSFTNVLVFRLPASESVVRPASRCPSCGRFLSWYENIPILSWLALRGRCRTCRTAISIQYPLVELTVGLLFAGNFLLYGPGREASGAEWLSAMGHPQWIIASVFITLLLAIALTDVRTYLIPDELSVGGMVLGILLSLLPGGLTPLDALLGAVAGGGLLLGVAWLGAHMFGKEAMGGGDIKMLAMVGAFTGWRGVFLTLFLGALMGSIIYGPITLIQRSRQRRAQEAGPSTEPADASRASHAGLEEVAAEGNPGSGESKAGDPLDEEMDRSLVPFGFFLAPAAAVTFYLGDDLVRGYLRLVGLGN
jgi:leader peptidase (prepilin peptidase)/N-methyltransferase